MSAVSYPRIRLRKTLLAAFAVATIMTVFAIDMTGPGSHNVADLYVLVILVSGFSLSVVMVVLTTLGTVALTWAAFLLQADGDSPLPGTEHLVGRGVSTLVIGLSALVVTLVVAREVENARLGQALQGAKRSRASDKRMLAAASAVAEIGTWAIDIDKDRMTMSDNSAQMHGFPPGIHPLRSQVLDHMSPADAQMLRESVRAAWEHEVPFRHEVRISVPGLHDLWVVTMGEKTHAEEDSTPQIRGTIQDITTWKQAELAATNQHHRFAQLTNTLPIIVWTATPEGMVDYFNNAMAEYTGRDISDLLATGWAQVVQAEDLDNALKRWAEALTTGEPYEVEFRMQSSNGDYLWHHISAQAEYGHGGVVVGWWGSAINIDAARSMEARMDELAVERKIILESMNDGVYTLDEQYRIAYMNASAEAILDRKQEDLLGHFVWDVDPGAEGRPANDVVMAAMEKGVSGRITYKSTVLDKWLDLSVTRNAVGVTVFLRDVTELKSLSEQLSQSQRLEAIGQLTGGIAHDFNNLLTVVLGGADTLVEDDSVRGEAHEMAEMIGVAAERGAELTHRLLAFARLQPLEPQAVDLVKRLHSLEPLLANALGEHISLVMGASTHDAAALVDPGQYDNAVLNLAINARDAMPRGGQLEIEVEAATFDDSYVTSHVEVRPGSYVVTTITDSGEGIPEETLSHLFDPFFTTKETGKGSGLGLAMVWGFVKQSGGHITVYSEPGLGASFKMYLPSADTEPEPERPSSDEISTQPATGTILIAEDDYLVRRFASDRLRARGYHVVQAGSGPEALEALQTMDRLDLLFTDVIMPGGLTGRDLADAVLELRPGTPVLFASGYTENVIIHNGQLDHGVKLLAKPYSTKQLLHRVSELVLPTEKEDL
jgi:PAS domain S-box-containing protein